MVLRSVGVLPCGKIFGALYAILGLVAGCIMSLVAVAGVTAAEGPGRVGIAGMAFGAGAIVLMPLFYGMMGFIGGAIGAAVYNVLASVIGGIELEFTHSAEPSMGPTTPANW